MSALHLKGRWGQGLEGGLPDVGEDTVLGELSTAWPWRLMTGCRATASDPRVALGGRGIRKQSARAEWGGCCSCLRTEEAQFWMKCSVWQQCLGFSSLCPWC